MKAERLFVAMGNIDEELIRAAVNDTPSRKPTIWLRWGAAAACLCLITVSIFAYISGGNARSDQADSSPSDGGEVPNEEPAVTDTTTNGPASFRLNGRVFLISSYLSVSDVLPEGFAEAGVTDIEGYEDCPYYLNPEIPEWVYVYHEVRTDGTIDDTGTLVSTEPHDAYVRYVDERLRGKDLLFYNGEFYISLWSADCYGEEPDVTSEYYDEWKARYGLRIAGEVPDGFLLAGTTAFTGYDTIPDSELSSNKTSAEVYYDPDVPDVILVATCWFTAVNSENGETQHEGYGVYVRYDCPIK